MINKLRLLKRKSNVYTDSEQNEEDYCKQFSNLISARQQKEADVLPFAIVDEIPITSENIRKRKASEANGKNEISGKQVI